MKRVAFVTHRHNPHLTLSDELVVPILAKKDIVVEGKSWDDWRVDWSQFAAVIVRSAWDYHLRPAKFKRWLNKLEDAHVQVWNSPSVIRWNIHKSYLLRLELAGARVVPSVMCSKMSIAMIHRVQEWDSIVIKPTTGASSFGIKKFSSKSLWLWIPYVLLLLRTGAVIIQKYMRQVTQGEYSLIFFDKIYSHAVIKIPKKGEFRSQEVYGGRDQAVVLPERIIEQAKKILMLVDEPLLYARVDGFVIDEKFYLIELEVIEPYLFLETDPKAPKRFADAIYTCLNRYTKS